MFPFDATKPVVGKASVVINKPTTDIFVFIGDRFFENYPKWALEVTEFQPLNGLQVFVGARAEQLRRDQGQDIKSVFEITEFHPFIKLTFKGLTAPYMNSYYLEPGDTEQSTLLTFSFTLLELELFMRPFEKLIRTAIEEGAENTVENIKNLLADEMEPTTQFGV
ncbi:MAG: hypothetical protein WAW36_08140 [Methylovulum miyakonense]|uniref:SRPBCC family protein n=1 Tax=Methylovulum miyakonense TaxID=645578 RepID=UPI003BB4F90A